MQDHRASWLTEVLFTSVLNFLAFGGRYILFAILEQVLPFLHIEKNICGNKASLNLFLPVQMKNHIYCEDSDFLPGFVGFHRLL